MALMLRVRSMNQGDVNYEVLRKLETLNRKVMNVQTEIRSIRSSRFVGQDIETEDINLPLDNFEDFENFEQRLENAEYRSKIMMILGRQGGSGARQQCRLLLRKLLSVGFTYKFNWLGRGLNKKKAFHNTRTADLVRNVLLLYGHSIQDADAEIKEFLRTAGDRAKPKAAVGEKRKSKSAEETPAAKNIATETDSEKGRTDTESDASAQ